MDSTGGIISTIQFPTDQIILEKEIGSGSFGKVYKASIRDSKYGLVAIKVFLKEIRSSYSKQKQKAYEELNKCAILEHENVVKLIGMVDEDMPWLIFEYMKDGNLLDYVLKRKDHLKERSLTKFARDISNGMAYLHCNNIIHKDLAARNILLDGKRAKIADLGLSSILREEDDGSYALGGKLFPYRHAAVECVVEEIYTFETDVWAFGVLMWEMWTGGRTPYGKENKQPEVRRFVVEGLNPMNFFIPSCHQNVETIFKAIFQLKRENRPQFEDLTPVFESILKGGKIQMPIIRSRDPSPYRGNPNDSRSRSGSNEKNVLPGTVSNRLNQQMSHPSNDSGQSKAFLNVLKASSQLSTSTPNLHSTFNPSRGHARPRLQKEGRSEDFYMGSPPSHQHQLRIPNTPPTKNDTNFGGRRSSGDGNMTNRTIGKATSFNNMPRLLQDNSNMTRSSAKLNGTLHAKGIIHIGNGSQSNLDQHGDNTPMYNGYIPNRFGKK